MIDHMTARQALATSFDFPLPEPDTESLRTHLQSCAACRAFDASLRSDAAVLRDLDFGAVPVAVRANVAIAAERTGGGLGRWFALVAVGALLIVALGGGVLGVGGRGGETAGLGANDNSIHWTTGVVEFSADEFWIDANGLRFTAEAPLVAVVSDPGNETYRTLEATWHEHGVEMRLNLYFDGDGSSSWVREIRVYDGSADAKWVTWEGTWFKTPNGGVSVGNLDLATAGVSLHVAGVTLGSTPFDGVIEPPGGGAPVPAGPINLFGPGEPLHCSGILQMSPAEAEQALLSLGYRLGWRFVTNGYWDPRQTAPEGVIQEPIAFGMDGEMIIPVVPFDAEGAAPIPFPEDCPVPGGSEPPNLAPPTPMPSS